MSKYIRLVMGKLKLKSKNKEKGFILGDVRDWLLLKELNKLKISIKKSSI